MLTTHSPARWRRFVPLAVFVAMVLLGGMASPALSQPDPTHTLADAGRVLIKVESDLPIDARDLVQEHGTAITNAWPQYAALFGAEPAAPQIIVFVDTVDPAHIAGMRWANDFTYVSPDGSVTIVAIDPFLGLTPIEAGNVLRNVVSRGFVQAAAGGQMPLGLLDGIARYVETPVAARQARLGSLVQGLDQSGTLPGWTRIVTSTAPDLSTEEQTASSYALVAFLTDRYGVASLRNLIAGFASTTEWTANLASTFGQSEVDLAAAWNQFLPRWFASGWRDNAVSAFDLSRAEELFARGAYEAAAAEAERSQRLFTDLDDQVGLSRVEALLAQCAIGLQADSIMADAQAAHESNAYIEVLALLTQADALYALLPDPHRPVTTIERYGDLANDGAAADSQLERARGSADNWLAVTTARRDAVTAGDTYALLGNADGVTAATLVVSEIDTRIQRMVFVLSALVVVLCAWLGVWTWQRSPGRLMWRPLGPPSPRWRAGTGGD